MGDRTLAVLETMVARPGNTAVLSISELAAQSDVDPSTLTRLGQRLGFSGFGPLQDIFRDHVAATQPFYSRRVQELVEHDAANSDHLRHLAGVECKKVLATANGLDDSDVERAVDHLVKAKHVHVLGLRSTYAISYFFGSFLGTLREGVSIMGGPGFPITSELSRIGKDDVLVVVSYHPYTKALVKAVELIRASGTPIISLTDTGPTLEIAPSQGVTLKVDQAFYFDSALSQFYVAQAVLVALARRLGPQAVAMTAKREQFNKALDIETG
nr:MurR/RpiR family transcriptional regulator [Pseudomonas sp.]